MTKASAILALQPHVLEIVILVVHQQPQPQHLCEPPSLPLEVYGGIKAIRSRHAQKRVQTWESFVYQEILALGILHHWWQCCLHALSWLLDCNANAKLCIRTLTSHTVNQMEALLLICSVLVIMRMRMVIVIQGHRSIADFVLAKMFQHPCQPHLTE